MSDLSSSERRADRQALELLLQPLLDSLPDPIFVKDRDHRFIACNHALCTLLGRSHAEIVGKCDTDLFPPTQATLLIETDDEVIATHEVHTTQEELTDVHGHSLTLWTRKCPLTNQHGDVIGVVGISSDITNWIAQIEAELDSRSAIIQTQEALLEQLGAPVIQVWDGMVLIPLVGPIDERRAERVMETMLATISRDTVKLIIIDITGVPLVDTAVASSLIRSVRAAQLLGCRTLLVGIRPEIAQTLVGLGVDFSDIVTRATLKTSLREALHMLNYRVQRIE